MRARGFTLVEVMVALAIVGIALPAVMMALSQQMNDTAYLRDKTIAQMVAANKLAEMRLVIASTRNLTAGKDNGIETMVQRDWHWWAETKTTPVENFYRVEIDVALEADQKEQPLYSLSIFMSGDLEIDPDGLQSDDGGGEDGGGGQDGGGQDDGGNQEGQGQTRPGQNITRTAPDE